MNQDATGTIFLISDRAVHRKELVIFGLVPAALLVSLLYWEVTAEFTSTAFLWIHIATASFSLLAGSVAIFIRKGSNPHRAAGKCFVFSMIAMGTSAVFLALSVGKWFDILSGLMACYFVVTSWTTLHPISRSVKRRQPIAAFLLIIGYLALDILAFQSGVRNSDAPLGMGFVFAGVLAVALLGDLNLLIQGEVRAQKRIARHLWRVCFALFMATVSFFPRTYLFPQVLQDSGVLYFLALAPLVVMFFWLIRILIHK